MKNTNNVNIAKLSIFDMEYIWVFLTSIHIT